MSRKRRNLDHEIRTAAVGHGRNPFCVCCGQMRERRMGGHLCRECQGWANQTILTLSRAAARRKLRQSFALIDGGVRCRAF